MQEFFTDYYTFYYVGVTIFFLAGIILLLRLAFSRRPKPKENYLSFKRLNNRFENEKNNLERLLLETPQPPKKAQKLLKKTWKAEQKRKKADQQDETTNFVEKIQADLDTGLSSSEVLKKHTAKVYVLSFVGNIMASAVEHLRDEISFLLEVATPEDEIVVRLTSPGGAVAQYGLASSQLARLISANLSVTVCVDTVAASGGYMMASVANKIVAAPFAFIGSIGVVAGVPNFHRVLQKNEIDYLQFTAGKHKRTVTPFVEVTEEGKQKFQEELTEIHQAFKNHIVKSRENIDIEEVATGEYWLANQAKEKGLVDEILTSDDYINSKMEDFDVIEIKTIKAQNAIERFFSSSTQFIAEWIAQKWLPPDAKYWKYSGKSTSFDPESFSHEKLVH